MARVNGKLWLHRTSIGIAIVAVTALGGYVAWLHQGVSLAYELDGSIHDRLDSIQEDVTWLRQREQRRTIIEETEE